MRTDQDHDKKGLSTESRSSDFGPHKNVRCETGSPLPLGKRSQVGQSMPNMFVNNKVMNFSQFPHCLDFMPVSHIPTYFVPN